MRTGDDVLVSTPVNRASAMLKPGIERSKAGKASRIAAAAKSGRQASRLASMTPGA
jgi:hypothetical protein